MNGKRIERKCDDEPGEPQFEYLVKEAAPDGCWMYPPDCLGTTAVESAVPTTKHKAMSENILNVIEKLEGAPSI